MSWQQTHIFYCCKQSLNSFNTHPINHPTIHPTSHQTIVGPILKLLLHKSEKVVFWGLILFSVDFLSHIICPQLFKFLFGLCFLNYWNDQILIFFFKIDPQLKFILMQLAFQILQVKSFWLFVLSSFFLLSSLPSPSFWALTATAASTSLYSRN